MEKRVVAVLRLPETTSAKQEQTFLRELQTSIGIDRPRIVLDCSHLRDLDKPAIHLLLCCLEEVMKRNGDVRLAALPLHSVGILEQTGVSRLFDIYDTTDEAVNSFHQIPNGRVARTSSSESSDQELKKPE